VQIAALLISLVALALSLVALRGSSPAPRPSAAAGGGAPGRDGTAPGSGGETPGGELAPGQRRPGRTGPARAAPGAPRARARPKCSRGGGSSPLVGPHAAGGRGAIAAKTLWRSCSRRWARGCAGVWESVLRRVNEARQGLARDAEPLLPDPALAAARSARDHGGRGRQPGTRCCGWQVSCKWTLWNPRRGMSNTALRARVAQGGAGRTPRAGSTRSPAA
jgi:hypothetical protein